jgi:hypothetical protein
VRFAIPECSINSPIKIKRGIGANEKRTRDVNICCTDRLRPLSPPIKIYAPMKLIRRNAKAMGSPIRRKRRRPPSKSNIIPHHSISLPPGLILSDRDSQTVHGLILRVTGFRS